MTSGGQPPAVDFEVQSWEGRVRKKGHRNVNIALEKGKVEEEEEEGEFLFLERLCQCKFTLEMSEEEDAGQDDDGAPDGQQKVGNKVELLCVTSDLLPHLQRRPSSTSSTGGDSTTTTSKFILNTSESSDIEERIAQSLQEKKMKMMAMVKESSKSSTEVEKKKKKSEAPERVAKVAVLGVTPDTLSSDSGAGSGSGSILSAWLTLLVTFLRELVASGRQLAVNVISRGLLPVSSSKAEVSKSADSSSQLH